MNIRLPTPDRFADQKARNPRAVEFGQVIQAALESRWTGKTGREYGVNINDHAIPAGLAAPVIEDFRRSGWMVETGDPGPRDYRIFADKLVALPGGPHPFLSPLQLKQKLSKTFQREIELQLGYVADRLGSYNGDPVEIDLSEMALQGQPPYVRQAVVDSIRHSGWELEVQAKPEGTLLPGDKAPPEIWLIKEGRVRDQQPGILLD